MKGEYFLLSKHHLCLPRTTKMSPKIWKHMFAHPTNLGYDPVTILDAL